MTRCEKCDEPIDEIRIEAFLSLTGKLPTTCQTHGSMDRPVGFTIYGHKTAGDVVFLSSPTPEQVRQMKRAYNRSR